MTKKIRTRFDALADELFGEPEPDPKPEPAAPKVRGRDLRIPKRDAYLSARGQMFPVMTFEITTNLNTREYDMPFAGRESHRVKIQIAGVLSIGAGELLREDAVLVILTGPEPEYLRLQVTDVRMTMTNSNSRYTEIEAHATGIG